jgi:hypothetical protein
MTSAAGAHWVTESVGHRAGVHSFEKEKYHFPFWSQTTPLLPSCTQGSLWPYPDWPISSGTNKLNYTIEVRRKTHCAYFKTLWLMEHQVSRKCYVSLQAKVRMSHGTDRPLAFVNTVMSFLKKKSKISWTADRRSASREALWFMCICY